MSNDCSELDVPFLQIEPTTRCNFICGFCAGRHMPQQNMALDVFERALSSVHGLRHVELQGEGEPMLHPDFFRMGEMIRRLHPGRGEAGSPPARGGGQSPFCSEDSAKWGQSPTQNGDSLPRISLITNGSLFSAENVARLIDLGFHKVCVSIESRDPDEFTAIRGGKLEKVLDGIRLLLEARRQRQAARPAVGLAITILRCHRAD